MPLVSASSQQFCCCTVGVTFASSEGELEEPLLSSEDRSEEHGSFSDRDKPRGRSSRAHGQIDRALVPHSINRINWEELWRLLWANCCSSWSGIVGEQPVMDIASHKSMHGAHEAQFSVRKSIQMISKERV